MNHPQRLPCAMSTGDAWRGAIALTSLSNKESTGSYDSVISMNSDYSEDSMEHLSAEERACLMYLEQTIEACEVQEDSGLSNDEPDSTLLEKMDFSRLNLDSRTDQRSESVRTLLDGLPVEETPECGTLTEENVAEDCLLNPNCERSSTTASEASTEDLRPSGNLISGPRLQVPGSITACDIPLDTNSERLWLPPINNSPNFNTFITSELDLGLIPPPSDFMDNPGPDAKPGPELASMPDSEPDPEADGVKDRRQSRSGSISRPVSVDLNRLYQRALEKRPPISPPVKQKRTDKVPINAHRNLPALEPLVPAILHPEATEPKNPRIVAPLPESLSVNTSHQTQTPAPNSPIRNSDQQLFDHERIHLQALQKLGLLKGSGGDSDPAQSQELTPQTRKSWADLPYRSSQSLLSSSNLTSSAISVSDASPIPSTGFNTRARLLLSDREQFPVNNDLASSVNTQKKSPPLTPSDLVRQLTKVTGAQSRAAEPSGQRLSRPVDHQERVSVEQCLSHAVSPDFRRRASSHLAFQHSLDSQKQSQSQGVSVLICPRDENGVGRREALKKLGLIRD
ncbi:specifically androgen-regulated gene protein-like [Syngnathoides biaculeatus]|uniref:specifically androgen-regulated gene protein-like n=1 Tax=Syngnathoides biaculeatus TaxID=300417 RepID=UPI002ADE8B96|nr:specifically androgen-regulated gene protein-like [Syngnathoides biaculeatus]